MKNPCSTRSFIYPIWPRTSQRDSGYDLLSNPPNYNCTVMTNHRWGSVLTPSGQFSIVQEVRSVPYRGCGGIQSGWDCIHWNQANAEASVIHIKSEASRNEYRLTEKVKRSVPSGQ